MFASDFDHALLAKAPSPYAGDFTAFLAHARRLSHCFSTETRELLGKLRAGGIKYHQFRDIPVTEALPPTRTDYVSRIPKPTFESEAVLGAAAVALGRLFGYEETSPYVMYDIYPVQGLEKSRSFVNSRKMLSFHSDGSAHPQLSPDFVLLYCIRSDPDASNLIVDLDALLGALPASVVDTLKQPVFKHLTSQVPERHELKPILFAENGGITVRYDEENVSAVGARAMAAQDRLNDCIHRIAIGVPGARNSLLVINNRRCVHARTSFTPKFDGTDRWIKGAFVTRAEIRDGTILRLPESMLPAADEATA